MSNPDSRGRVPVLFRELGNWVGDHFGEIGALSGISSLVLGVLNIVFGVRLTPYGDHITNIVTSDSFLLSILVLIAVSQIMVYQRVAWIVEQLESEEQIEDEEVDREEEPPKAVTDGGSSNLPPRDSKGRFKTKNSGGSNLLLILLAGAGGYLIATDLNAIDPAVGALIGIALISFLQAGSD